MIVFLSQDNSGEIEAGELLVLLRDVMIRMELVRNAQDFFFNMTLLDVHWSFFRNNCSLSFAQNFFVSRTQIAEFPFPALCFLEAHFA